MSTVTNLKKNKQKAFVILFNYNKSYLLITMMYKWMLKLKAG